MNDHLELFRVMAENTRRANLKAKNAMIVAGRSAPTPCPTCAHPLSLDGDALVRLYLTNRDYAGPIPFAPCRECATRQHLEKRGVPLKLVGCSFDNWVLHTSVDADAAQFAKFFCESFEQTPVAARKHTLVLSSKVNGTGKSHLAVAIMRRWAQSHSRPSYFVNQMQIGTMLADTYRSDYSANPKHRYGSAPFVVLDDLGQDSGRRDEIAAVEEILTERDNRCGWTVCTTNLEPKAFAAWIGPRIASRFTASTFAWLTLGTVSRRTA